jgi:hypothetical protein
MTTTPPKVINSLTEAGQSEVPAEFPSLRFHDADTLGVMYKEGSKLGAVAPHHAYRAARKWAAAGSAWQGRGRASPVASPFSEQAKTRVPSDLTLWGGC